MLVDVVVDVVAVIFFLLLLLVALFVRVEVERKEEEEEVVDCDGATEGPLFDIKGCFGLDWSGRAVSLLFAVFGEDEDEAEFGRVGEVVVVAKGEVEVADVFLFAVVE